MFEKESKRLDQPQKSLPEHTRTKYVSWDIDELLDYEDPSINHDRKVEFLRKNHTTMNAMHEDMTPDKEDDIALEDADLFQPAPNHWKQIMTLPLHLRKHWAKSFKAELNTLLRMKTFAIEEKPRDEPVIPVTAKFRVKLQSNGKVEKLKTRICLRGDKQQELTDWDTWCPIAGFRELRKFFAFNASIQLILMHHSPISWIRGH